MNKLNSLYFSFFQDKLLIFLINESSQKIYSEIVLPRNSLEKNLLNSISQLLKKEDTNIKIQNIFLHQINSSWNANRLVSLVIKTIAYFSEINFYTINSSMIEASKNTINLEKSNIFNYLKLKMLIQDIVGFKTQYNTCPVTNI